MTSGESEQPNIMPITPRELSLSRSIRTITGLFGVGVGAALLAMTGCSLHRVTDVVPGAEGSLMFPSVNAQNLLDEPVALPDDLLGAPAVVHVAFFQKQQELVNTWLAEMGRIEQAFAGVRVIETPVIKGRWAMMAGFIDNGMRSGILEQEARARTITLFTDTRDFRAALDLPTDRDVYTLLLDADGRVLATEPGVFSEKAMQRLIEAGRAVGINAARESGP